jgi:hypothetical protein
MTEKRRLVSQKSSNQNFIRKYFVSVIGKFQLAVSNGNMGLMSLRQVGGSKLHLGVRCSSVTCLRNKHHAIFNSAASSSCWSVLESSRTKHLNTQFRGAFLMLLYEISQTSFDLLIVFEKLDLRTINDAPEDHFYLVIKQWKMLRNRCCNQLSDWQENFFANCNKHDIQYRVAKILGPTVPRSGDHPG